MYYKIFSTEKCICFLFLVILFILNCSGFRIDNSATMDVSNKKNPYVHTSSPLNSYYSSSSSTSSYSERVFNIPQRSEYRSFTPLQEKPSPHKIRHRHRLMIMKQSRNAAVTSSSPSYSSSLCASRHMRTSLLFPSISDANNITPLDVAQNPQPYEDSNSNKIQKRSFSKTFDSATSRTRHRSRKAKQNEGVKWKTKQIEDIKSRAHKAEYVFYAKALARNNSSDDKSGIFRICKSYKRSRQGEFKLDVDFTPDYKAHYLFFLNSSMKSVAKPKTINGTFNDTALIKACSKDFRKYFYIF